MQTHVHENPKHPNKGIRVAFPYEPSHVEKVKTVLGFSWNNDERMWESQGPEVLLDMHRFGIEIAWISQNAREIAEGFQKQLKESIEARKMDISEQGMYAYQEQGVQVLTAMKDMILGDDMGLGKSKQSLEAAKRVGAGRILVVLPKTLCYNWVAEVEKWHPEWTVAVVPDNLKSKKKRGGEYIMGREEFWQQSPLPEVIIANYEKVKNNDWPSEIKWDIIICDEATRLKNANTDTYRSVKYVINHSKKNHQCIVWPLTGTPLEIRLMELYNIMNLCRPSVLGNYVRFRDQHLVTDWAGTITGAKQLELLRERIAPFIIRRTKKEVLTQLPDKIFNNVYIKMSEPEIAAYQAMTSEFDNWLTARGISGGGNPLVETLRMRQFCATPALFTDELGKGSKFEMLKELIEEWDGKVVVFCFFSQVISLLREWFDTPERAVISGEVNDPRERLAIVDDFNAGRLGKILLSTDAGGMGLNITGANLIVHYDQLWNPQRMHQREDRLHRIGQTDNVTVVSLLNLDTIDVGMYQLNREREKLFEEVIDGAEEALLKKIDAARWRKIIAGRLTEVAIET